MLELEKRAVLAQSRQYRYQSYVTVLVQSQQHRYQSYVIAHVSSHVCRRFLLLFFLLWFRGFYFVKLTKR